MRAKQDLLCRDASTQMLIIVESDMFMSGNLPPRKDASKHKHHFLSQKDEAAGAAAC